MSGRVLVAGIGNIFFGDDAFGSEVARRLLRERWPEDVRVVDFGIRGLDLTFALLDGYETIILVDALPRGGVPGTICTLEVDAELEPAAGATLDAHAMDPMRVLAAAKSMGARWDRLLVVGCEPSPGAADPDGPGALGMSPAVEHAVEEAAEVVRRLVCGSISVSSAG
jgi:hydrogenase maturation protease